jgi:Dyp-type peroxidase family
VADRLPRGIYFREGQRPAACFRLLLLDAQASASADEFGTALQAIASMLEDLRRGCVRELAGLDEPRRSHVAEQYDSLEWVLGYGRRLWDSAAHPGLAVTGARPEFISYLSGPEAAFPELPWSALPGAGEADVVIQLTAECQDAVNCAAVEIWKLLTGLSLPVLPVASYEGFGRHDGRGWLEFHDGVSNIAGEQRQLALEATGDPDWMAGGTYLAFLRLRLDLSAWRLLERAEQELLIGRDKRTGAPLVGVERSSEVARPIAAEALGEHPAVGEVADYEDPPQAIDPLIEASHIHRANQNRASAHAAGALRIFRQGYDFLEGIGPEGPILGLNFVSFQRDLAALQHILHLPGWLGDVNFGGPSIPGIGEPEPLSFISLDAGGLYAVPAAEAFPGAALFG